MDRDDAEETRAFWNRVARDWDVQVGDDGDSNRILNSDPVLWQLAGDVSGLTVLDAGCGTGYLSRKLTEYGAHVIGLDFAEEMIAVARAKTPHIDFRVDSCARLTSIESRTIDVVIANYVLMDTPELEATINAFYRVLRADGVAVVVFSHPCFPQGRATRLSDGQGVTYHWDFPYFERRKCVDPPWAHFTSDFIWFHRSLSDYWKAFTTAGFQVLDFEEPRVTAECFHLADNPRKLDNSRIRPYSVAFKLGKIT